MMKGITKEDLQQFEDDVAVLYEAGKIKAPIHLSDGNEDKLIEIFTNVEINDWVFSTHRSHYHALLHGVPRKWLLEEIVRGLSITLNYPPRNFFSSAIMGGSIPIAVGRAMGIKMKHSSQHVWAFVGDMAAEMGIFHEMVKYAERNDLPITFVVEDNGMSVGTPTQTVWGPPERKEKVVRYSYEKMRYPHVGCGKWVTF